MDALVQNLIHQEIMIRIKQEIDMAERYLKDSVFVQESIDMDEVYAALDCLRNAISMGEGKSLE